jgi:hypothetical protein
MDSKNSKLMIEDEEEDNYTIVEESKEEGISKVNRTENVKNAAEVTLLYSSKSEKPVEIKG